jgi:hypothetical protein
MHLKALAKMQVWGACSDKPLPPVLIKASLHMDAVLPGSMLLADQL